MAEIRECLYDGKVGAVLLYGKTATGELVPVLVDASGKIVVSSPS